MIALADMTGKTYAVMGLDRSGLASVRALCAAGARVLADDDKPGQVEKAVAAGAVSAKLSEVPLEGITALVLTPGIPHRLPRPHSIAARFIAANIPVIGDIELFAQSHPAARIVGITGTNGKSTTTALITHILQSAGIEVAVGGNFGIGVLDLPVLPASGVYVLELSSYQLERCPSLAVDVGIMLNLTSDHLDRHGDMAGYAEAKANLFARPRGLATAICGADDEWSRAIGEKAAANGFHFQVISVPRTGPLTEIKTLPGSHNWQNAEAARLACHTLGLDEAQILAGLNSYPGLDHRQQLVGTTQDIHFVNDSKATNADATAKALGCYNNIYWIIGGKPKPGGLAGLEEFMPRIRHAFLIGEATEEFAAWLNGKITYERCGELATATACAFATALAEGHKDAVVLLSPACASFDQFRSFEERGVTFAALARAICSPPQEVADAALQSH